VLDFHVRESDSPNHLVRTSPILTIPSKPTGPCGDPIDKNGPTWGRNAFTFSFRNLYQRAGERYCYRDCHHNRYVALMQRVVVPAWQSHVLYENYKTKPDFNRLWRCFSAFFDRQIAFVGVVTSWTPERVLSCYSGSQRTAYALAYKLGLKYRKHGETKPFVKTEGYCLILKPDPYNKGVPRLIQATPIDSRAVMATFIKPLCEISQDFRDGQTYRWLGSGLDQHQAAKLLIAKFSRFECPVGISFDFRRYDAHKTKRSKQIRTVKYCQMTRDEEVIEQMHKEQVCTGKLGWKDGYYRIEGRTESGRQDTSKGNSDEAQAMFDAVYETLSKETLVNGEDVILVVEQKHLKTVTDFVHKFNAFGHVVKIVGISQDPYHLDWCQSRIDPLSKRWLRKPSKVLDTLFSSVHFGQSDTYERLLATATGELSLNAGTPAALVCQTWIDKLSGYKPSKLEQQYRIRKNLFKAAGPAQCDLSWYHEFSGLEPSIWGEVSDRLRASQLPPVEVVDQVPWSYYIE